MFYQEKNRERSDFIGDSQINVKFGAIFIDNLFTGIAFLLFFLLAP